MFSLPKLWKTLDFGKPVFLQIDTEPRFGFVRTCDLVSLSTKSPEILIETKRISPMIEALTGINAVTVLFLSLCVFAIGYRFYGLYIPQKILVVNGNRQTQAVKYADGQDYVKTDKFVLFGHHFRPLRLPALFLVQS